METFREKQRFNQWYVWFPFGVSFMIVVILTFTTSNLTDDWYVRYMGLLIMIPVAALLWFCRLETKIDEQAIYVRFVPFINKWKKFTWNELSEAKTRKYNALVEYGGWGLKGYSTKNRAYNISGNLGLQLTFTNGKKVLIGTNKKAQLDDYLLYLKNKYHIQAIWVD